MRANAARIVASKAALKAALKAAKSTTTTTTTKDTNMNAFHNTIAVLQMQVTNLMAIAVRENAIVQEAYTNLICDSISEYHHRQASKAARVRVIEDHEREVNSAGAAAEIVAKALREMGGFEPVSNQYEIIWTVREDARRMASKAEDLMADGDVAYDILFQSNRRRKNCASQAVQPSYRQNRSR